MSWLTLLLIFGGTALFLANSRALYYWDNAIYHSLSCILEKEIAAQPLTVLEQVYYTIQTWDYNYLGALLPAVFMRFFGSSRGVFVVVCMGLYLLTAVMVFYLINRRIGNSLKAPRYSGVIFLGIVLGFPLLPFLTLNGSIDVGGVTLMLLCCYLYFDEEKPYFPRYLLCGFLLLLLVLFRRWYMFWSVAFLIVAAIDRFVRAVENREARIKSVKNWFLRMVVLFGSFGVPFVLFFDKLLVDKYLLTSVVSAYQAYAQGMGKNIQNFCGYFGALVLVLSFACAIYNLFYKKTRRITLFLTVQAVLCFCLLSVVQSHDIQHLLLYVPFLFYMFSLGVTNFCLEVKAVWLRRCVCALLAVCAVLNFTNTLHPSNKIPVFAQFDMQSQSKQVSDTLALLYSLDRETAQTGGKVVVLSASDLLNTEKLSYAELSLNLSDRERDYFLIYSTVDRRDGFSDDIFEAQLIVVPSSQQAYLGEENMRVITVPTQYFYENKGFARAFERLDTDYTLGDGTSAAIYRKVREITQEEKAELQNELASYYPDLPDLFPTM